VALFPDDEPRGPRGRLIGRPTREQAVSWTGWGLLVAAVLGTIALGSSPAPYVIEQPGPVFDTLGDVEIDDDEVPLIEITGEQSYPTEGRLDMLTVHIVGSRERPASWFDLLKAYVDPTQSVVPIDAVFPVGQTDDEADEESAVEMSSSQQSAVAAALTELDIPYGQTIIAQSISAGSPADGVLEAGDEFVSADGAPVVDGTEVKAAVLAAGTGTPVELVVRRGGVEKALTITPALAEGEPRIGVVVGSAYDFPVDVEIQLENVGGPSAGQMFALAIYDKLTPGALTGGEHIAGTGTITAEGDIGAIGGIRQKMYGARDAGATWFLAPAANCDEVTGNIPDGLTVVAVETLDDSLAALAAVSSGVGTDALPACPVG
jgi:PDZ domain-containing protein